MGFERVAYKGLETGSRATASHVVRNGEVTFVLTSPLRGVGLNEVDGEEDGRMVEEMHGFLERHGDAVKGVFALSIPRGWRMGFWGEIADR